MAAILTSWLTLPKGIFEGLKRTLLSAQRAIIAYIKVKLPFLVQVFLFFSHQSNRVTANLFANCCNAKTCRILSCIIKHCKKCINQRVKFGIEFLLLSVWVALGEVRICSSDAGVPTIHEQMGNKSNAHKHWRENVTVWRTSKRPKLQVESFMDSENDENVSAHWHGTRTTI